MTANPLQGFYESVRRPLFRLLRVPEEPPEPPAGSSGSVRVFRAAPNFLKLRIIIMGISFAAAFIFELIALIATLASGEFAGAAIPVLLLFITAAGLPLSYFLIRVDYELRYYIVTDRSLRIREGALLIREATFTYANVQNLRLHQGPIERLLGISNVVVQTAGGASPAGKGEPAANIFHRGVLRGISNAREVRDLILALLKKYRDAGLGDPEDRRRPSGAPARAAGAGTAFSAAAVERLREIRAELRRIRAAVEKS